MPASEKVTENPPPGETAPESQKEPVVVWVTFPLNDQVTVSPACTVTRDGPKRNSDTPTECVVGCASVVVVVDSAVVVVAAVVVVVVAAVVVVAVAVVDVVAAAVVVVAAAVVVVATAVVVVLAAVVVVAAAVVEVVAAAVVVVASDVVVAAVLEVLAAAVEGAAVVEESSSLHDATSSTSTSATDVADLIEPPRLSLQGSLSTTDRNVPLPLTSMGPTVILRPPNAVHHQHHHSLEAHTTVRPMTSAPAEVF